MYKRQELLYDLKADGVENVLALRGDRNPDYPPKTEFLHADELVAFIRRRGDFGVSAACYPEMCIRDRLRRCWAGSSPP